MAYAGGGRLVGTERSFPRLFSYWSRTSAVKAYTVVDERERGASYSTGHTESCGDQRLLRSSDATRKAIAHASAKLFIRKLFQRIGTTFKTEGVYHSSTLLTPSRGQCSFSRAYHARGSVLQAADAIASPPKRQETGDRNVDIFDRDLKKKHRDRAALLSPQQDPLLDYVTEQLLDRLDDIKREFPVALSLGGAGESVRKHLWGRGNVQTLYQMDLSQAMLDRAAEALDEDFSKSSASEAKQQSNPNYASAPEQPSDPNRSFASVSDADRPISFEQPSTSGRPHIHYVAGDEELLPFKEESLDLVISSLSLHWVNDLPGAMIQARRALKPDGLFLAAMFGGETLKELRIACSVAELEREGGVSARVSPLVQVRDAGNLLGRASLALPAVDVDTFTVNYPSALELVEHIRSMGEGNAVRQRRLVLPRDTALATAAAYQAMFANEDGSVPATFQIIYMAGWAPHSVQQKPRQRGSATVSFEDLAEVVRWDPETDKPKDPG